MGEQIGIYPQDPFFPPGAPLDGRYITQEVNPVLTDEQSLGLLTTGMLKNTVAAGVGVLSIGTPGTDYLTPGTYYNLFWKAKQLFQIISTRNIYSQDPTITGIAVGGNLPLGEWYGSPSESFFCQQSGAVAGDYAYLYQGAALAHMDSNAQFFVKYVTGPSIANVRIHLGLSENPLFPGGDNVPNHTYSFRFSDAVSPNWYAMTRDGVPVQTATDTGIQVLAGTVYQLEVIISLLGTQVDFLINGVVVHTTTTDLSPVNTGLGFGWRVATTAAAGKRGGFTRIGIIRDNVLL